MHISSVSYCNNLRRETAISSVVCIMKIILQNKIQLFIPSEQNNVYIHQHPSMATCFGPFLDHPQANI